MYYILRKLNRFFSVNHICKSKRRQFFHHSNYFSSFTFNWLPNYPADYNNNFFFAYFPDECCVNVEVSALLEHWLGWDHHSDQSESKLVSDPSAVASPMPTSWADRLVSHLVEEAPSPPTDNTDHPISIWVRKFCSEIGCDVLKKQDNNGKTLLHHLLSGK